MHREDSPHVSEPTLSLIREARTVAMEIKTLAADLERITDELREEHGGSSER